MTIDNVTSTDATADAPRPVRFLPSQIEFIQGRLAASVSEIYAISAILDMLDRDHITGASTTIMDHAARTLLRVAEALQTDIVPFYEGEQEVAS